MTKGSWSIGDELSFREAKPEPGRIMELELAHKFRMRAGISGFAGFEVPSCGRGLRGFHVQSTLWRLRTR